MATITVSDEARRLLDQQLDGGRFESADDLLQRALRSLARPDAADYDDLDADTRAAIERAEAEYARGLARPWAQVRDVLRARFTAAGKSA